MVTRWDPYAEMLSLRDTMSRLMNEGLSRPASGWQAASAATGFPFDLYETADQVVVRVAVPGIDQEQLELSVHQNVLAVKAARQFYSGDEEKQLTWHARGLSEGNVQFAVGLPTAISPDAAEASYDAGILTITLPKAESVKPKRIQVRGAATPATPAITSGSN